MRTFGYSQIIRAAVLATIVAGIPMPASGVTIDAVADIWIRESAPDTAYSDDLLSVWDGTTTDQRRHGVVVFDLTSTVGTTINSVYLDLFDRDDGRSASNPLVQQAYILGTTPGTFITDLSNVEAYTWTEYTTFDEGLQQAFASLGAYDIATGDTANGYEASDLATAADIGLLESVRNGNSNLVVFILQATAGERDWGDIEFDGTAPRLVINELPPVLGDFSGNGSVGIEDYNIMIDPANWLQNVPIGTLGDLNEDGFVGLDDFNAFKPIYLDANPGAVLGGSVAVPEPGTLGLAVIAAFTCIGWRSRAFQIKNIRRMISIMNYKMSVVAVIVSLFLPGVASAVVVTESYDSWIRDEGLTLGDRDGDWLGVYNSEDGARLPRWSILEFDLSGLAPLTVNEVSMGFWHMFAGSPIASSDNDPSSQTVAQITEIAATTATPSFTWGQLNDPGQVTLTNFDSLGAIDLQGLAVDPSEADRYHFGTGSSADIAMIQSIVDAGGTLRVAVRSDESTTDSLRVDWGDGPDDGDASHGQSTILLINEAPPEIVELTLQIDAASGQVWITNPGMDPAEDTMFDLDGYIIRSPDSRLNPGGFTGLTGAGESGWQIVAPTIGALSETSLTSSTLLAEGDSLSLGTAYMPGAAEDVGVTFEYSLNGVAGTMFGNVEFITSGGVLGDYNGDGVVDAADYTVWRDNQGQAVALANQNPAAATPNLVDDEDYDFWRSRFGATSASGSLQSGGAVPEPSTLILATLLASAALTARRKLGIG